jgi:hypothetical protein
MKTELNKLDNLMIITAVSGLILATLALLLPIQAEAGVAVRAQIGSVGVAVATDSPRGMIVQTGPRTYHCDMPPRPARPLRGQYVWVQGHFEKVLKNPNGRQAHQKGVFKPIKGKARRTKLDYQVKGKPGRKGHRHNHYRKVWVPAHWERV